MKYLILTMAAFLGLDSALACPNFSGKYDLNVQVTQVGCDSIRIKNLSGKPAETQELSFKLNGAEFPRAGNNTWVESMRWDQDDLVFVSRYSDEYIRSGVKIGEHVDTKKVTQFSLLQNENVRITYSVFNIHGQPVDVTRWHTVETRRIP